MSAEQAKAFIDNERKAGISDIKIFLKMQDHPVFSKGIKRANDAGLNNRQFAQQIGLKIAGPQSNDTDQQIKTEIKNQAKKSGKTKAWESALLGASDLGAGVVQGFTYAADGINKGVNKALGTNLDTESYDRFTKQRKDIEDFHNARREANGQGFDGWRMAGQVAATAPMAALGKGYQGINVVSKAGAGVAAQNAAVGAVIGASGFAKDSDARLMHTTFGGVGGAVGGAIGEKIGQGVVKATQTLKNQSSRFSTTQTNQLLQSIDNKLDEALQQQGMTLGELSDDMVKGMRTEALKAIRAGGSINPTAVARKVVLNRLGLKGTRAQISGDAKQWQQEAELAKIQGAGEPLRNKFIDDNSQLRKLLDDFSDSTNGSSTDRYGAMDNALNSIDGLLAQNKTYVREAYAAARNAPGNDIKLDGQGFANDAFSALDQNYAASSLPGNVQKIIKDINDHPDMFTLGKSEEFIKILNREHKASLMNGQPTSATHAVGLVRDALNKRQDEAMEGLISNGNDAASLYQFARKANSFNAQQIESMPLLKDAVKGVEPDKLFNKHILGGNIAELSKTVQLLKNVNPQAVNDIKQQFVEHISSKSINGNGQFSPAGMKKALDAVGDRRLLTMFSLKELSHLKDIGKAADYMVTQPPHSYVNNSNTSSALANHFMNLLKLPGARVLLSSVKDVPDSIAVSNALKGGGITSTNKTLPNQGEQSLIDRLTQAGVITGANLPNQ
ncbi:hypothetical protein ACK2M2_11150 [Acinetobacter sp. TY1]|uniref:hypothetical protein n=1 Tax=Acinetobacter sp. TY1 TaxID=3387626 RepID=UPI003AF942AD